MPDSNVASRFARLMLTLGARPSGALLGIFVCGVLILSIGANWLFAFASEPGAFSLESSERVLGLLVLLLVAAFFLWQVEQKRMSQLQPKISESANVSPHRGLIWLLSPGRIDHPALAIGYHYGKDVPHILQHCWLIMLKGDPTVQEAKQALAERLEKLAVQVELHAVEIPRPDVESTYHAVEDIVQHQLSAVGLTQAQVIADVTGGLKPMTAGMTLACLWNNLDVEYIESDRDENGRFKEGTQRVVQMNVSFAQP